MYISFVRLDFHHGMAVMRSFHVRFHPLKKVMFKGVEGRAMTALDTLEL